MSVDPTTMKILAFALLGLMTHYCLVTGQPDLPPDPTPSPSSTTTPADVTDDYSASGEDDDVTTVDSTYTAAGVTTVDSTSTPAGVTNTATMLPSGATPAGSASDCFVCSATNTSAVNGSCLDHRADDDDVTAVSCWSLHCKHPVRYEYLTVHISMWFIL
ncbi:uncharacterized protein LOC144914677 [Branchiostoma floridae x Branchiostoma belcheri]